jgi:hypothetical protein
MIKLHKVNVLKRDSSRKMSMDGLVGGSMSQNTTAVHAVRVEQRRQMYLPRNGISVITAKKISTMIWHINSAILETTIKSVNQSRITLTIIVIKIVVQDLKRQLEQTRLVYI